jgi:two-component system phosphate regulon sensor histidine kinase PhoR
MNPRKLIWQLYPSYLAITLIVIVAVTAYSSRAFRHVYYDQIRSEMNELAGVVAEEIHMLFRTAGGTPDLAARLDDRCKLLGRMNGSETRLTVILPSGKVVGDSHEDPATMMNHADRPEIIEALQHGSGSSVRFSPTLGLRLMYVAVILKEANTPLAVVRAAIPVTQVDDVLHGIYVNIFWAGLLIAAGAAGLSLWVSRRITAPIISIKRVAERFAAGELHARIPLPASTELAALAESFNKMAAQLGDRITTVTEQRNKLDAILSSMAEGVFAVDNRGRLVSVNPAAARLLNLDTSRAPGRPVEEVIRHVDLQEFVRQTLAGLQPAEMDISLPDDGAVAPSPEDRVWRRGRSFRLHGAALTDARGRRSGAVFVLNDTTRVRQLETIRRDFVANVSHELKTPITSIQGFVEALADGTIDDPAQVARYLSIVARHASRLNAIIDDLLTLSRLEEADEGTQTHGPASLRFTRSRVKPLLGEAISLSGVKADAKHMTMELACRDDLEARINPPLLEQALINLIDNAVKYSPEGSRIHVEATAGDGEVAIAVRDEGCGIAREHLPRIFERFYVVDKSRSRKLGGTGLGLAIVKHIAQAHGGRVTVDSTPGQGSTFTLYLPHD